MAGAPIYILQVLVTVAPTVWLVRRSAQPRWPVHQYTPVWLVHSDHGALIYSWSPPGIAMVVEPTDSHFDAADHLDEVEEVFLFMQHANALAASHHQPACNKVFSQPEIWD